MMKKLTAERCKKQIEEWQRMMSVSDVAVMVELNLQAYLIALPVLEQQEKVEIVKSLWVEWRGNFIPGVVRGRQVQVRYSDGTIKSGYAAFFNWGNGVGKPVIAYRLVEQERERGEEE